MKTTMRNAKPPRMSARRYAGLHWKLMLGSLLSAGGLWAQNNGDHYHAPDVLGQFAALKHHGVPMGYHVNDGVDDPSTGSHNQGVARALGPDGVPYLFVSHSYRGGFINIVRMASREQDSLPGERWRSNRLSRNTEVEDTPPPAADRVVQNIRFASVPEFLDSGHSLKYSHPGGMQMIDNVLAVACSEPEWYAAPAVIVLIDMADPLNPKHICTEHMWAYMKDSEMKVVQNSGAVAITRDTDGKYLIAAIIDENGDQEDVLIVWKTTTTNLRDLKSGAGELDFIDWWHNSELADFGDSPGKWEGGSLGRAFQSLSFVREQGTGRLFLLCGRSSDGIPNSGNEWVYVFEAFLRPGNQFKLDYITQKEFKRGDSTGQWADFGAASGAYVSPSGQLLIYSTVHDNDGPDSTVRFAEYHNYRLNHAGLGAPCNAWVELYEHDHGWERFTARSVICDGQDRELEDYGDLDKFEGFTDKASSVVWNLPEGCIIRLWEHDGFRGKYLDLHGGGGTHLLANLHGINWTSGSGTVGDYVSSVQFIGPCADTRRAFPGLISIGAAVDAVTEGPCSILLPFKGSYREQITINKRVTIKPRYRDGVVTIGK